MNLKERIGIHAYGHGSLEQQNYAARVGTSVYQVFWGSPQRYWARKESSEIVNQFKDCVVSNNHTVVAHAPYLINLADDTETKNWKMSLKSLQSVSQACVDRGVKHLVVHAGSDKGRGFEAAAMSWHAGLDVLCKQFPSVTYCIENSAYVSNIFHRMENMLHLINYDFNMGLCFDTAHYWSAGGGFTQEEYDKLLQLQRFVKVIHLNDHPLQQGCNLDRHTNTALGQGRIDSKVFRNLVRDFRVPVIMELEDDDIIVSSSYDMLESLFRHDDN